MISVVSGVANCIPRYIRTYLQFSIQQWGNEGGGVIARFQDFPPVIFLGLFLCHREYCQVFEKSEIAFVAICGRSSYKMPGLSVRRCNPNVGTPGKYAIGCGTD